MQCYHSLFIYVMAAGQKLWLYCFVVHTPSGAKKEKFTVGWEWSSAETVADMDAGLSEGAQITFRNNIEVLLRGPL